MAAWHFVLLAALDTGSDEHCARASSIMTGRNNDKLAVDACVCVGVDIDIGADIDVDIAGAKVEKLFAIFKLGDAVTDDADDAADDDDEAEVTGWMGGGALGFDFDTFAVDCFILMTSLFFVLCRFLFCSLFL